MRQVLAMLTGVAALLAVASPAHIPPPINVPVVTKYVTTEVTTVDQDETLVLTGQLCSQSKGMAVKASVLLNNNPGWDPALGVMRYYIVDSQEKTNASALCSNVVGGVAGPTCTITSWPSTNDIYIKGTAGSVAAISFSLDVELFSPGSEEAVYIQTHAPVVKTSDLQLLYTPKVRRDPIYLTEIITLSAQQPLAWHRQALMNFTFCSTPATGTVYEVQGTVTAADGQSSYTQYLCDKLPCAVDGPNVVAHNGKQLPNNIVTTATGKWINMYVLTVCWGGVYNSTKDAYIGHFLFNGQIVGTPH